MQFYSQYISGKPLENSIGFETATIMAPQENSQEPSNG